MKQFYTLLLSFAAASTFAQQQTFSFEQSEGYQLGTINGQNGWTVTERTEGFIENQVISNEQASQGTFSFKNGYEADYDWQYFPIMGTVREFSQPIPYQNFTISYDFRANLQGQSDFEFVIYGVQTDVDGEEYFAPIGGVGMENRGYIYFTEDENYGFTYATAQWNANQWYNLKIEVTATQVNYYVNNVLDKSVPIFSPIPVAGFNMLHNNFGGDGYYDNIVITSGSLSVKPFENNSVAVYPNPTSGELSLLLPEGKEVSEISVFNIMGQKVASGTETNFNISELTPGTYMLQINATDGTSTTKKIVKN